MAGVILDYADPMAWLIVGASFPFALSPFLVPDVALEGGAADEDQDSRSCTLTLKLWD